MKRFLPESKAGRVLLGVLTVYIFLFFWLACRKLEFGTAESGDVAAVNHLFWSSLHGKFFWHFGIDRSYFAMHQEWLLLLFWPMYALAPCPQTLFFLQTVCIAASAVPMYLIARRFLQDDWGALAAAVALVMYPSVVSQNVNQLHTSQWVLPLLLAMFYCFMIGNFRWFAIYCVLAVLGKENTPLTVVMFVPYAFWNKRSRRWWLFPACASIIMMVINFKIAGPYFAQGWKYEALGYLSNLGDTWGEVIAALLSPKLLDALFQTGNGQYLMTLLQPALWMLPLMAPEIIFAMPDLGTNLIAGNTGMKVVAWHYNINTGAFIVLAAISAIPRLEQRLKRWSPSICLKFAAPVLLAVFAIAHWPYWFVPQQYQPLPQYAAQREARELIPHDASVLVGPQMLVGQFSSRLKFMTNDRLQDDPKRMFEYDWAYFDVNLAHVHPRLPRETIEAFMRNPSYELVYSKSRVLVFHRRDQGTKR